MPQSRRILRNFGFGWLVGCQFSMTLQAAAYFKFNPGFWIAGELINFRDSYSFKSVIVEGTRGWIRDVSRQFCRRG
jgi:hypothetical protein